MSEGSKMAKRGGDFGGGFSEQGDGSMNPRRRVGRVKIMFALGVLFSLCLLWFGGLRTRKYSVPKACKDRPSYHLINSGMDKKRMELYDRMEADFENGATFLDGGETSQSLKLSDLFKIVSGKVTPVLKPADPPVRASVLYLHHQYASKISEVVENVLSPHFSRGVWYQDPKLYHFSLFHASHHIKPVLATDIEVHNEATAVEQVAKRCCPLEIVLDRIVLTSTGVLIGCWRVLNGTDPANIREELRKALPKAPEKQLYDPVILHSSFARILGPPDLAQGFTTKEEAIALLKRLVLRLNEDLCNFQVKVKELWYVEELDILALALKGRIEIHMFPMVCSSPQE